MGKAELVHRPALASRRKALNELVGVSELPDQGVHMSIMPLLADQYPGQISWKYTATWHNLSF